MAEKKPKRKSGTGRRKSRQAGAAGESKITQEQIDRLLKKAPSGAAPMDLADLQGGAGDESTSPIDMIMDVSLDVRIELGKSSMTVDDILKLREGAVVTLDKLAGDFVDIFVNDQLVARGEVLVLNDNFCVRVAEIISPRSRPGRTH